MVLKKFKLIKIYNEIGELSFEIEIENGKEKEVIEY